MSTRDSVGSSACPVDHDTRSKWVAETSTSTSSATSASPEASRSQDRPSHSRRPASVQELVAQTKNNAPAAAAALAYLSLNEAPQRLFKEQSRSSPSPRVPASKMLDDRGLSTEREVSSIPRYLPEGDSVPSSACPSAEKDKAGNWVYPSPSQFYAAMARKNHKPDGEDMPVVVPIHNAVNERAWAEILEWDRGWGTAETSGTCGGLKLVSFQGKPKERTWKAWARVLMGYRPPFDRHDWIIDRCGERQRFIIDFYSGRSSPFASSMTPEAGKLPPPASFYLDVRPAPDSVGILMRLHRALGLGGWKDISEKRGLP